MSITQSLRVTCTRNLLLGIFPLYGCCSARGAQQYSIQNLSEFVPLAINDSSQIAGTAVTNAPNAGIWTAGTVAKIPQPGPVQSFGQGINNAGEIVGWAIDPHSGEQGFSWTSTSGIVNPVAPPDQSLFAVVNNLGQIGGSFRVPTDAVSTAAIWRSTGALTPLPALPGADDSVVNGLNDLGQAVGSSSLSGTGLSHAVLWQNGNAIDLTPGAFDSAARAINNEGQAVGYYYNDNHYDIPFIWSAANGLVDLPGIGYAADINEEGQIIGMITDPNDPSIQSAAFWEAGQLYNLNDLIPADSDWDLQVATSINNCGQIVGEGTYNGQNEGFLLTPTDSTSIPEPATILLAPGFCLLASFRRRHW